MVLLPSPTGVLLRLFSLLGEEDFLSSILFTLSRISLGFFLAMAFSFITVALSRLSRVSSILLEPLIHAIKSVPVASITILLLIWISSRNLSVAISFLMSFPVLHVNLCKGMEEMDVKILEMARLYKVGFSRKLRYVYIPLVFPYFESGIRTAVSLAWKSGIAAEVIAIPSGSIGEKLFDAKVYLASSDLFAWTLLVVLLAFLSEKLLLLVLRAVGRFLEV